MDEKFAQFAIAHIFYRQQLAQLQKISNTFAAVGIDPMCKCLSSNWKILFDDRMLEEKRRLDGFTIAMEAYRSRLIEYCRRNRQPQETIITRTVCGLRVTVAGFDGTPTVIVSSYLCKLV